MTTAERDADTSPAALPDSYDIAITPTSGDEFLVVNGAVGTGRHHPESEFTRVTPTATTVVAQLDVPLRFPVAWTNRDHSVTVIGMDCADDREQAGQLACKRPALVRVDVQPDDVTTTQELGISTNGTLGISATSAPSGELLVLAYPEGSYNPHLYRFASEGASAVDLGTVETRRLCQVMERVFVYPSDVSRGSLSRAVYEVTSSGLTQTTDVAAIDSDVTTVSACSSDGTVIIGALVGGTVIYQSLNLSDPEMATPLDIPADYANGTLEPGDGTDLLSWTLERPRDEQTGFDVWQLHRLRNGIWKPVGSLESSEQPMLTTAAQEAVATVAIGPEGRQVKVLP